MNQARRSCRPLRFANHHTKAAVGRDDAADFKPDGGSGEDRNAAMFLARVKAATRGSTD